MATGDKLVNLNDLKTVYDKQNANEAMTEASLTASAPHPTGSYFYYGGVLYQATADIANGGTIVTSGSGANCKTAKLGDDVASLKSAMQNNIEELAQYGSYHASPTNIYIATAKGFVQNFASVNIDTSYTNSAYVKLSSAEETKQIQFDAATYKCNLVYFKNGTNKKFTGWITESPIIIDSTVDHDEVYVNVRKLSGNMGSDEYDTCLYYTQQEIVGNLATKDYVESAIDLRKLDGKKCIYPDSFTSRIKPDIYFNGKYYADIDLNNYKISGTGEVWVATDGNDTTGDGTEGNPYLTITKALTQSAKTINLKAGTYEQGTHYATDADFYGRNFIGHGAVILQNDSSGNFAKATASAYFENIIFKHGSTSSGAAFKTFGSSLTHLVCFVGCIFRDGADNGLSVNGNDTVLVRCTAFGNKLDGFNYHDRTISGNTYIPNVLEIDCIAYNNGTDQSGSDSCNGSTAHDGTKIIRLNGEYYSCYGGVIAEIARTGEEPTMSVNFGVLAHDSTGTGTYKASFWASINTQMYLYDCSSYGGTYDISAINDAKIVSWRLTTGRDEPSVNEASTATVIQH